MKKRHGTILAMALMLGLTACGGKGLEQKKTQNQAEPAQVEEATEEIEEETHESDMPEVPDGWESLFAEAQSIKMQNTVTVDNVVTFSIESGTWSDEVLPQEKNSSYSYLEDQEGYSYLVFQGTVNNLTSEEIEVGSSLGGRTDSVATVFVFDESEAYYGRWYVGTESVSYSLEAGAEEALYIVTSVPDEIKDQCKKIQLITAFSDMKDSVWSVAFGDGEIEWDRLNHKYFLEVNVQ